MAIVTLHHPKGNGAPHGAQVLINDKSKSYERFLAAGYIDGRLEKKTETPGNVPSVSVQLDDMKAGELKEYARENGFDVPGNLRSHEDILDYVKARINSSGSGTDAE